MLKFPPKIILSDKDYEKLSALAAACRADSVAFLEEELGRAVVVGAEEIPEDTVTMNSIVQVTDLESGAEQEFELVFPHEASVAENRVSVLAPIGVAAIGLRLGAEYEWLSPNRRVKRFRISRIRSAAARKVMAK